MNQEPSTLYAKLLGETASITWKELEPFFAKGALLWVDPDLDLIAAAEAVAQDEGEKVAAWLAADKLAKLSETRALDLFELHLLDNGFNGCKASACRNKNDGFLGVFSQEEATQWTLKAQDIFFF